MHVGIKQQLALHRLGLFYSLHNLHASVWNIPEQEMADCHVTPWVWAEHTRVAIVWPGSWGKVLALAFSLKAKTFMRCPWGQGQVSRTTRLLITRFVHHTEYDCAFKLLMKCISSLYHAPLTTAVFRFLEHLGFNFGTVWLLISF